MKRQMKSLQLKISNSTFEMLRAYKQFGGMSSMSEAIETLIEYSPQPSAIEPEDNSLTIESEEAMPKAKETSKAVGTDGILRVSTSYKMPESSGLPKKFSTIALDTFKAMKVGDSVLVKNLSQKTEFLRAAKMLKGKAISRTNDKGGFRVWRSA